MHVLWFVDGETIHMSAGAPDFQPRNPLDDQFYRIVDVRNPAKPAEVGRWWLPGTREGDAAPPPQRLERKFDMGFRAHNTNVYPARPDRAYVGYIDGGALILDISDKSKPKVVAHWRHSPPFNGFTHTVLPLLGRNLLVVSDESLLERGADVPKLVWVLTRASKPIVPISTLPAPPYQEFVKRGGLVRRANLHETCRCPAPGARADRHRQLLQRRRARLRPAESLPAEGSRLFRALGAERRAYRRGAAERRLCG